MGLPNYVGFTCRWCAGTEEPPGEQGKAFDSVEDVQEHFVKRHGKDRDAVGHYGLSGADIAAEALKLGIDVEAELLPEDKQRIIGRALEASTTAGAIISMLIEPGYLAV